MIRSARKQLADSYMLGMQTVARDPGWESLRRGLVLAANRASYLYPENLRSGAERDRMEQQIASSEICYLLGVAKYARENRE